MCMLDAFIRTFISGAAFRVQTLLSFLFFFFILRCVRLGYVCVYVYVIIAGAKTASHSGAFAEPRVLEKSRII